MSGFKRVILVDPSLRDHIGHHIEYDRSLALACRQRDVDIVIFAHKEATKYLPHDLGFHPVFSEDMWGKHRTRASRDVAWRVALLSALQFYFVLPHFARAAWTFFRSLLTAATLRSSLRALASSVLRPPLRKAASTMNGRCIALAESNRSRGSSCLKSVVQKLLPAILPTLARGVWQAASYLKDNLYIPSVFLLPFLSNSKFYFELTRALEMVRFDRDDLVFCHMVFQSNILEWAYFIARLPKRKQPQVVLLLRYPANFYRPKSFRTRLAFRVLERAFEGGKLRLCTDSERLAREFAQYTYAPFEIFPIPHTGIELRTQPAAPIRSDEVIRLASLGNARAEKGIVDIFEALRILAARGQADRYRFVLQVNDPDPLCAEDVRRFASSPPANVDLIATALSTADYKSLVESVDAVLLPYWQDVYASRTSGILIEAIAAGKPVIVTENTWMSDQISRYGSGILVPSRDPAALADAIERLAAKFSDYRAKALAARTECLQRNSASALLTKLLNPDQRKSELGSNAVVIYPWRNLLTTQSGAALRVWLLIQFLLANGWSVGALASCANAVVDSPRVRLYMYRDESYSPSANTLLGLYVLIARLLSLGKSRPIEWMLFLHRYWCRSRDYKLTLNRALLDADAVFVEYTFLSALVRPFCSARGIPMIVTDHDVLANRAPEGPWRDKLFGLEASGLRLADLAVTVSVADQEAFRRVGVSTVVVPNSIMLPSNRSFCSTDPMVRLCEVGITVSTRFVLFVGSDDLPNATAVPALRLIAEGLKAEARPIYVVVAGSCASPSDSVDNYLALGSIDERLKAALYARCEAVVIPLTSGTGTSLKAIEAMAFGAVIIGTTVGFRGYPVQHGIHALVCDDLRLYPDLIRMIIKDKALADRLRKNARALAEHFDYRVTYKPYIDFLRQWYAEANDPKVSRYIPTQETTKC